MTRSEQSENKLQSSGRQWGTLDGNKDEGNGHGIKGNGEGRGGGD